MRPARSRPALGAALAAALLGPGCTRDEPAAPVATTAPPATAATTTTAVPDSAGKPVVDYSPAVGDCFDVRTETDPASGRQSSYRLLVDCSLPHEQEVFAVVTAPAETGDPGTAPGEDQLRRFARLQCPPTFAAYVGQVYELSRYTLGYVLPTAAQWGTDHRIGCTLTMGDGSRTTGSGRGSRL